MGKFFSITNENYHKIFRIFNIKFKLKQRPKKIKLLNVELTGGIGNRVFSILYVMNYFSPDTLNLYWDNKGWVPCNFLDIFEFNNPNTKVYETADREEFKNLSKNGITFTKPPVFLISKDKTKLDKEYLHPNKKYIEEFSSIIDSLKPSKKVIERMKDFNYKGEYIGLQIRNNKDWNEFGRGENIELFIQEIEKTDKNLPIYLSAMNEEVRNYIKERYKDRILELPNKNYNSMIDAVSDLYILSKSTLSILSYGSTFGMLQWWLSKGIQKVVTVGNENGWKTPEPEKASYYCKL